MIIEGGVSGVSGDVYALHSECNSKNVVKDGQYLASLVTLGSCQAVRLPLRLPCVKSCQYYGVAIKALLCQL